MFKSSLLKSGSCLVSQCKVVREAGSYRVLVIPGHTKVEEKKKETSRTRTQQSEFRYKRLNDGKKWVDVWPTAKSFNYSVSPLPVRMGFIEATENDGVVPGKYANTELMKIPNFLHLTTHHIKKHCKKLKKLCTKWPKDLNENNYMHLTHYDYVRDAPAIKDDRARFVSVTLDTTKLKLTAKEREKFMRLTSRFCVKYKNDLIITSGKCPTKQQNFDYIKFLLSVLYKESQKEQEWENTKELTDMVKYDWSLNKSRENIESFMKLIETHKEEAFNKDGEKDEKKAGEKTSLDAAMVKKYGKCVEGLLNGKEDIKLVSEYKNSVKSLYSKIMPPSSS